jgi:hypothetical protein
LCATTQGQGVILCVLCNGASGSYRRIFTHRYRCYQLCIRTDEGAILYSRSKFICAVIITGNRACANIYIFSDFTVAKVAKMAGLTVYPQLGILYFEKIADPAVFFLMRTGPDTCKRSNFCLFVYNCIFDNRIRLNDAVTGDGCVFDDAAGTYLYTCSNIYLTFKHAIYVNKTIVADTQLTAYI